MDISQGFDLLPLAETCPTLAELGLETRLHTRILTLVQKFAAGLIGNPLEDILIELGPDGEQYFKWEDLRPLLKRDVWTMLIIASKSCDVVEQDDRFARLAALTVQLCKGIDTVRSKKGPRNIGGGQPDLSACFRRDLKLEGEIDSGECICRVAYFLGHLGKRGMLAYMCDELFVPCASLIIHPVPAETRHSPSAHKTWCVYVRIASFWMRIWAQFYASDEWACRQRAGIPGEQKLPRLLDDSHLRRNENKWTVWKEWKDGFMSAQRMLSERSDLEASQGEILMDVERVLELMQALEAGHSAQQQQQHMT